jgi:ribosomal-protein-alanine N-acetyltransferase
VSKAEKEPAQEDSEAEQSPIRVSDQAATASRSAVETIVEILRPMTVKDLDAVAAIERTAFAMPWSREALRHDLEENIVARYLVMEADGEVAGYGGVWLVIDEAHITNIAVRSDLRRRGYGERILRALMRLSAQSCMGMITLEVRRSNEAAQTLYRKLGFQRVGYRKRYYEDNNEDALIMYAPLVPVQPFVGAQ